jgi:hypothetical protein
MVLPLAGSHIGVSGLNFLVSFGRGYRMESLLLASTWRDPAGSLAFSAWKESRESNLMLC